MSDTKPPRPSDSFVTGYLNPTIPPQNTGRRQRRRWPLLLTGFVAGVAVATTVAVWIGSISEPTRSTGAAPSSTSAPTSSGQGAVQPAAAGRVGATVTNGGITMAIKSAGEVPSISVNESNFRPGSGYETYTAQTAGDGAKFFAVSVHVVNDAKESIDLTCSLPVSNKLLDDRGREFDAIDSLYKLQNNPECNDNLQPGFEADMTYVYRVPASATITQWSFADATESFNVTPTLVDVR
jgi:hypothetical protein